LDDIDRKIISQLQLDGRTTLEELGKIVGYTSMGVKKRLKKLRLITNVPTQQFFYDFCII
jgi:DNA-binding Lrp family transcriptional regulator